jgi:hypothetical protein
MKPATSTSFRHEQAMLPACPSLEACAASASATHSMVPHDAALCFQRENCITSLDPNAHQAAPTLFAA